MATSCYFLTSEQTFLSSVISHSICKNTCSKIKGILKFFFVLVIQEILFVQLFLQFEDCWNSLLLKKLIILNAVNYSNPSHCMGHIYVNESFMDFTLFFTENNIRASENYKLDLITCKYISVKKHLKEILLIHWIIFKYFCESLYMKYAVYLQMPTIKLSNTEFWGILKTRTEMKIYTEANFLILQNNV